MDNFSLMKHLNTIDIRVPVKIQIDDELVEIEDIKWTGLENEGCFKIILKKVEPI